MLIETIPVVIGRKTKPLRGMDGWEDIDWGQIASSVVDTAGKYLTSEQQAEAAREAQKAALQRQALLTSAQTQQYAIQRSTTPTWVWLAGAGAVALGAFFLLKKKR